MKGHGVGVCIVIRALAEQALLRSDWQWGAGPDHGDDDLEGVEEETVDHELDVYVGFVSRGDVLHH